MRSAAQCDIHNMKLDYSHSGRQFFFLTLTVAGREKILSRLVDAQSLSALSEAGEVVKAALLALHRVNAAVTVSDFVIMPDHFHFIMIVDYGRDRLASPLYLAHRLLDAVEWQLEGTGRDPEPRSAAGGAALRDKMAGLISEAIRAERAAWRAGEPRAVPRRVFDRDCYIELSFDSRQLAAIRRYIKLNPARAIWKQRHPDRFRRVEVPIERVFGWKGRGEAPNPEARQSAGPEARRGLDNEATGAAVGAGWGSGLCPVPCRVLHALGDLTLLGSPFFFHVRLTLKKTVAEHEAAIAEIVAEAHRGRIPVSGFISPGEREALRRLKATPGARFVKLLPHALPPRYDPSAEDSREIAAGRLLLLSGCPDTSAIASRDMRRDPAAAHEFRRNCLAMNELAAALCKK